MATALSMSTAACAVTATASAPNGTGRSASSLRPCRVSSRRGSGTSSLNARRVESRNAHVVVCSSENEEVVTSEAQEPEAVELPASVNDMQAMLQALMAENQALQGKIEELAPPAPAVPDPVAAPLVRGPLAPGELLTPANEASINWPSPDEQPPFWERNPAPTPPAMDECAGFDPDPNPLHVVHVTAEMAPIAKVGGLGDVVTGLARAHLCAGHNVEVILPFYSSLSPNDIEDLQYVMDFDVPKMIETEWDGVRETRLQNMSTSMHTGVIGGCNVILLKPASKEGSNIFVGGKIYGGSYNETEAYLYFCRASLECLRVTNRDPQVWRDFSSSRLAV